MRLVLVAFVVAGSGAAGVQTGVIQLPTQMVQAVSALGGDPATIAHIRIKSPQETFDDVQREITSGHDPAKDLGFQPSTVPTPDFSKTLTIKGKPVPDFHGNFEANTMPQPGQSDEHTVDMRKFTRNPDGKSGE